MSNASTQFVVALIPMQPSATAQTCSHIGNLGFDILVENEDPSLETALTCHTHFHALSHLQDKMCCYYTSRHNIETEEKTATNLLVM